ncbi:MAG: hypothetical protein LBQ32_01690 [Burkholderiaceae bacterium]|jgi:hypothetical protein|nr:hypothetical protein [Burkholderiaceae bacterium]
MWHKFSQARILCLLFVVLFLTACSAIPAGDGDARSAASLGTQWGEGCESRVTTVQARRVTPNQPDDVAQLLYGDADGVRAKVGDAPERQLNMPMAQGDVEWSVRDETDQPLALQRTRQSPGGAFNIAGRKGMRYMLVFHNLSERAYEMVATVDGLDVLNGQPGSRSNTGYVLYPRDTLRIEGFRKSNSEVAAFRFAEVNRAYAANTPAGDVRNVGVIGAALFQLEMPRSQRTPRGGATSSRPNPFPADSGNSSYAPPPDYRK